MIRIGGFFARSGAAAGILLLVAMTGSAARADCYELIGCTDSDYMRFEDLAQLSCENLWHVRNRIYDEHGYCFKTARGQQAFDNSDCFVDRQEDVTLSPVEAYNVERVIDAESENGCR